MDALNLIELTMASFRPPVEPSVLRWTREGALLSPQEAAKRIGVKEETLLEWESGESGPTLPQLRKAASIYRQPFAVFLLNAPPPESKTLVAFRTLPETQDGRPSRAFVDGMRRALFQQAIARYLIGLNSEPPAPIELRVRITQDTERASVEVRNWLGATLEQQVAWKSVEDAFGAWTAMIEEKQILVIHVAGVDLSEMRAFAERTRPVPVIALNGKDAPAGKVFSLIHELVHILLDGEDERPIHIFRAASRESDATIEAFCNKVAAAVLMPRDDVLQQAEDVGFVEDNWSDDRIRRLSNRYKVSRQALLLRLVTLGKVGQDFYTEKKAQFEQEYREQAQPNGSGGGDYYRLKVRDLGRRFITSVLTAYNQGDISSRDTTRYLGVQLSQVPRLAGLVERPRGGETALLR